MSSKLCNEETAFFSVLQYIEMPGYLIKDLANGSRLKFTKLGFYNFN